MHQTRVETLIFFSISMKGMILFVVMATQMRSQRWLQKLTEAPQEDGILLGLTGNIESRLELALHFRGTAFEWEIWRDLKSGNAVIWPLLNWRIGIKVIGNRYEIKLNVHWWLRLTHKMMERNLLSTKNCVPWNVAPEEEPFLAPPQVPTLILWSVMVFVHDWFLKLDIFFSSLSKFKKKTFNFCSCSCWACQFFRNKLFPNSCSC